MNTKNEFKFFTVFEYEKEQEYLRDMHKSGWRFVKAAGLGSYSFEKCEPEDVIYQLDYNQEGIQHKEEYVQMFHDCGWEYIQDFFGFSYFRKSAKHTDGSEEIFCDDESRLHMIERIFKGRLLPMLIIFSALLLPQFIMQLSSGRTVIAFIYGMLIGLYGSIFVAFLVRYKKFKDKIG